MWRWTVVLTLSLVVVLTGCSGGGSGGGAPSQTAATAGPTVDTGIVLSDFQSTLLPYAMSVPDGWQREDANFGGDRFFINGPEGLPAAELIVKCSASIQGNKTDAKSLLDEDTVILNAVPGPLGKPQVTGFRVGELEGFKSVYNVAIGGTQIRNMVAYFGGDVCGWRIRMNAFNVSPAAEEGYDALFNSVVLTFRPGSDPVPGSTP